MANELRHSDVGTALSKSEWEAVGGHIFNSQAAGDIMYASTTSQLTRLGIGTANQVLATNSGATAPEWVTSVASATLAATVTVVDSTDTSSYIAMFDSATGSLAAKTDAGITYNAGTGMLTATGFTGPLTGVASTATALASARTINGVSFDGTGNITVTAAGSTLSDTVPVSKGGTGATSLADKAVLISQDTGTDTVGAVALTTSGQVIIGGSSGPAAATLTAGSNITITNGDGSISIAAAAAGTPTAITVADSSNTTASVAFFESATGDLGPKTDSGLTYNAGTGMLTATGFTGPLTGTLQTAAQTNITSVGTIATGTWEATDVAVSHGGTGASTLTANGALIGNGTSAITSVAMDTKGDILIGDGTGNPSVLDVGTNDYVLTADSGEATGTKWAAVAAGVTLSGSTDNTVATVTGSDAMQGEANLTFDGSTLAVTGDITVSGGDITYGNGQGATLAISATAHDTAGKALTITGGAPTAGTTNDIAGGALTIQGGQGKGEGVGGNIIFQTSNPATSAASTLNSYTTALTIESSVSSGSQVVIPDGGSIRFDEHTGNAEDPGTDHTAHGLIFSFQSSGARDFGDVLYIGANGEVGNADADLAYAPAIGISVNAAQSVDHGPIDVLTHGIIRDDSWNWTKGGTLYVSTTSGELTQTKPSGDGDYVQIMGEALTDVSIFIMPSLTYVTVDA